MKTKINLKKGIVFFTFLSVLVGCTGITVIPTLVTKDITLAKVTVFGVQDKTSYSTSTTVDLTKAVDADKLKGLTTAKIKSFSLKIGDDYLSTVTNSTILNGLFFIAVVQGLPDDFQSGLYVAGFQPKTGDQADILIDGQFVAQATGQTFSTGEFDSANRKFLKFVFNEPFEMKDYIVDGKLTLNIAIAENYFKKFNDASFTFDLTVETEVEVEL